MDIDAKEQGRCDSGPKKGRLCEEDSECDESDTSTEAPGSFKVSFMTASPKCIVGSSWMDMMSSLASARASSPKGSSSSSTQGPSQDSSSSESPPQESSTGETYVPACFLECWIGVPFFRLAINIECGLNLEFNIVAKACFFPEPGAMAKVCTHVCMFVYVLCCMCMYMHTYSV